MGYLTIGFSLVVLSLGVALKVQTSRLESCQENHTRFLTEVERLGNEAKEKVKLTEALNLRKKEQADNELKKLRSTNADLSKRLRSDTDSRFLPRAEADTGEPKGACNADLIDRAIRDFAKGTAELIIEGQSAITDLNNAKRWANQ